MKTAKNMKELEKMILGEIKKRLPSVTREYCHKWYGNNPQINDIVSETDFIKMVNESLKISVQSGKLHAELGIFQKQDIEPEKIEQMKKLWEVFSSGYVEYVMNKILK